MMDIAIDTDVLILLSKHRKLDEFVSRFRAYITIITEYEYMRGEVRAGVKPNTSKRTLEQAFEILHFDNKSVRKASELWAKLASQGQLIDERDLIIGSICIANRIPLWTENTKHFLRLKDFGLRLLKVSIENWKVKEL